MLARCRDVDRRKDVLGTSLILTDQVEGCSRWRQDGAGDIIGLKTCGCRGTISPKLNERILRSSITSSSIKIK